MCLRYPPTVVACVCIHLACRWSKYRIPLSAQKKEWFYYIDTTATQELLDRLTGEFLAIFEKCPSRLKKKIMASTQVRLLLHLCVTFQLLIARPRYRVKRTKTSDWPSEEANTIQRPCWLLLKVRIVLHPEETWVLRVTITVITKIVRLMPTTKCQRQLPCNSIKLASMPIQPCLIQT